MSSSSGAIRLAAICVLTLALGLTLSACGRRGPLDAPPGVVNTPQGPVQLDSEGKPLAPPGEKKRIPLDVLLD